MNQDVFFKNFELLADAPNGVQKLRELILQLAVMGKLVPQDPNDEQASVLLEKIKVERERLVKKGETQKKKAITSIYISEMPYELPETWEWVRIDEVTKNVEYGTSEKASEIEDGIPVLRMNNVQNGKITYDDLKYVSETIKDLPRLFLKHNDLLFNRTNSYELVGKTGIFKGEDDTFTLASYLIRVSLFNECIIPDFINLSLNSNYFRTTQIEPEITQQCGQANFNGTKLKNSIIPLPPLAEQKRIVSKVDELMALCDKLEARRQKKQEIQSKLNSAALDRMFSAENQEEFEQHWQRIYENFDLLYDNPENVEKLKQAIFRAAFEGKLVPTEAEISRIEGKSYESASMLLERINQENINKLMLLKRCSEPKIKSIKSSDINNSPRLPEGWCYTFLEPLLSVERNGIKTGPFGSLLKKYEHKSEGVPVLGIENISSMKFIHGSKIHITENKADELSKYDAQPDDILISRSGTVGEVCVVPEGLGDTRISTNLIRVTLNTSSMTPQFFCMIFNGSPFVLNQVSELCVGSTRSFLNQKILSSIIFPLPPLNEQKRIVEKVEQFMGLCDELESKLKKEREDGEKLMETVLRGLLEGGTAEI